MKIRTDRARKSRIAMATAAFAVVTLGGMSIAAACGGGGGGNGGWRGGGGEDRKVSEWSAPKEADDEISAEEDWKFTDREDVASDESDSKDTDAVFTASIEDEAFAVVEDDDAEAVSAADEISDEADATPTITIDDEEEYTGDNQDEFYKAKFTALVKELGDDAGYYEDQLTQEQRSTGYELKYNSLKALVDADQ